MQIQNYLKKHSVNAVLVRSTDIYLNEYVPKESSIRYKLTNFDGSMGDAIITQNSAHLFVDGRYELQAKQQALGFIVHVTKSGESIESAWLEYLDNLLKPHEVLAYDPGVIELNLFKKLQSRAQLLNFQLSFKACEIFNELGLIKNIHRDFDIWHVSEEYSESVLEKLEIFNQILIENKVSALFLSKLDDIAWAINMRSNYFAYQATIPALACIIKDQILLALDYVPSSMPKINNHIKIVTKQELYNKLSDLNGYLGIDESETTKQHEIDLHKLKIEIKNLSNPIAVKKAIKHEKELLHMRQAFRKADEVVHKTIQFAKKIYEDGDTITEGELQDYLQDAFKRSQAKSLSFKPICAAGKNGAIIHYNSSNYQQKIPKNSLFLLDTGAFYEGGYATDLTRTFFLGDKNAKAQAWQSQMFTLVLKASIQGLNARIKKGSSALQLDGIIRQPLWQHGLDFAHGTGHGVGINVHEFPPRIGPRAHNILQEFQVFSIEPGIYVENIGGVRIENLVCLVQDPDFKDFLRVQPLTFCPFDEALIDYSMLNAMDKIFLEYYKSQWDNYNPMPDLPPLINISFAQVDSLK